MQPNNNVHANSLAASWVTQLAARSSSSALLEVLPQEQVQRMSPASLAYVGDAVYELYIRTFYLTPPKRLQEYHNRVVAQVRAEAQAHYLRSLQPHLTDAEQEILRRGRNAASRRPRRIALEIYQQATSLETLIGYLYLTDPQRLTDLLAQLPLEAVTEDSH